MFAALYNTTIRLYGAALRLAAPFHAKARLAADGRRNLLATITHTLADNQAPVAWFHAASLGEFEQGRPVMEAFRRRYPDHKLVLTFFSPSGYEIRKAYAGADYVFYLPLDTPANAGLFVKAVNPAIAFFIKYEFWYNYLRELHARRIPTLCFSAIFRPNQVFFKPYGAPYRRLLRYFDHILVQNEESVALLNSIGLTAVTRAGDTRFDRVADIVNAKKEIPVARDFKQGADGRPQPLLVVGSAWQADMDVLIPFLNAFDKPLKVIIAPHEIHPDEIQRWQAQLVGPSIRYSEIKERKWERAKEWSEGDHSFALSHFRSLIIDNVGMLSSLYQYGDFAYIGGAFGKGLHNILEAATFGMPLFFGPNHGKFQEAVDLAREGGAFPVADTAALATRFADVYGNQSQREEASRTCRSYVERNIGATAKVMEVVHHLMSK